MRVHERVRDPKDPDGDEAVVAFCPLLRSYFKTSGPFDLFESIFDGDDPPFS